MLQCIESNEHNSPNKQSKASKFFEVEKRNQCRPELRKRKADLLFLRRRWAVRVTEMAAGERKRSTVPEREGFESPKTSYAHTLFKLVTLARVTQSSLLYREFLLKNK